MRNQYKNFSFSPFGTKSQHPYSPLWVLGNHPQGPAPTLQLFCRDALTVRNFIWPLPLFIYNNDHHKDDDFCQNSQERPEWGQVAPYPEDGDNGDRANGVGSITFILARVFCDLEVSDAQLSVIFPVDDDEAARGIDNILVRSRKSENTQRSE
jgi:hypothetical protein